MTKMIYGIMHGKTIELAEDIGVIEGQEVEVHLRLIEPCKPIPRLSDGLTQIYAILGERYTTGHTDTAARHNDHQP